MITRAPIIGLLLTLPGISAKQTKKGAGGVDGRGRIPLSIMSIMRRKKGGKGREGEGRRAGGRESEREKREGKEGSEGE
jgi:hypothetical protein